MEDSKIAKELDNGKYLFKFCPLDLFSLQSIINNTLYFSHPKELNDPLDSKFVIDIVNPENFSRMTISETLKSRFELNEAIRNQCRNFSLTSENLEGQKRLFHNFFTHYLNTCIGITCFSLTWRDNLLWSHYSKAAKGICLIFDKKLITESFVPDTKRYILRGQKITYRGVKKLKVILLKNGGFRFTLDHLFSKTIHWKYEKEYRIILRKKEKDQFDFSYGEFNPFIKFDGNSLKYIMVGENISKENLDVIKNLNRDNRFTILYQKFQ